MSDSLTIFLSTARRSRSGCDACRRRRKKCDEERPSCRACRDRRVACTYTSATAGCPRRQADLAPAAERRTSYISEPIPNTPWLTHGQFVSHFHSTMASLISFAVPHSVNPFFSHTLPLAASSPLVRNAVDSAAAAHMHLLGVMPVDHAQSMHLKTLRSLSTEISSEVISNDLSEQLITASLLLIYYEIVLGSSVRAVRCHLEGIKAILEAGAVRSRLSTERMRFLFKTFLYFDVTTALSLHEHPLSNLDDLPQLQLELGVDEMFGLAGSLWPTIHHLGTLIAKMKNNEAMRDEAEEIRIQLQSWQVEPSTQHEPGLGNNLEWEAMLQIAETYRYSGLLTLYANELPYRADEETMRETFEKALNHLLRVCVLSGPMSTLTWPLYTIGVHARSPSDKAIVLQIFHKFQERQHMQVVDDARNSVLRQWASRDGDNVSNDGSLGETEQVASLLLV